MKKQMKQNKEFQKRETMLKDSNYTILRFTKLQELRQCGIGKMTDTHITGTKQNSEIDPHNYGN